MSMGRRFYLFARRNINPNSCDKIAAFSSDFSMVVWQCRIYVENHVEVSMWNLCEKNVV